MPGRDRYERCAWFAARSADWFGTYAFGKSRFVVIESVVTDTTFHDTTYVSEPFHVVRLANTVLNQCKIRVQNEIIGHRSRKDDPPYRCRRRLVMAREGITFDGHQRLCGMPATGDPKRELLFARIAKEVVRQNYDSPTPSSIKGEWKRSAVASKTSQCQARFVVSDALSPGAIPRSLLGNSLMSQTARSK